MPCSRRRVSPSNPTEDHGNRANPSAAADGFARLPWSAIGIDGETRLREQGITVRCLQLADGGVPTEEDQEGTLALVARAY